MSFAPPDEPPDEVLPGQDRPPSRWPVRLGAVLVVVAVIVGLVAFVRTVTRDDPVAAPSPTPSASSAAPSTSALPTAPLVSPSLTVPARVRLAIRAAYPGASAAVISAIVVRNRLVSRHYGARTAQRTIEIEIESDRSAYAQVLRTPRSLRLIQGVSGDSVSVRVTTRKGPTTQEDFLAVQQLIRDPRLLATR